MNFKTITFNEDSNIKILKEIIKSGDLVYARGLPTQELRCAKIQINDLEDTINLDFKEVFNVTSIITEPDFMQLNSTLEKFHHYTGKFKRFYEIVKNLKDDLHSRQEVIKFNKGSCINSIHFIARKDEVNVIINSRSTDAFKKLSNDLKIGIRLRDILSRLLNLKKGKVTLFTASLHIYQEDFKEIKKIIN